MELQLSGVITDICCRFDKNLDKQGLCVYFVNEHGSMSPVMVYPDSDQYPDIYSKFFVTVNASFKGRSIGNAYTREEYGKIFNVETKAISANGKRNALLNDILDYMLYRYAPNKEAAKGLIKEVSFLIDKYGDYAGGMFDVNHNMYLIGEGRHLFGVRHGYERILSGSNELVLKETRKAIYDVLCYIRNNSEQFTT